MKSKATWKKIGFVGVDSGTLMIKDPCYEFSNKDYDEYVCKSEELNELPL